MEQRTTDWFNARRGKFSSSEIYKLMSDPKLKADKDAGNLSEGAKTYIMQKIAEQIGFVPEYTTEAMAWGVEQEQIAKGWFSKLHNVVIDDCGFIAYNDNYGGSPDGITRYADSSHDIPIEVKCPFNTTQHLAHCMIDSAAYFKSKFPEYYWQCVSHMVVTNAEYCHFISFDSRIDHECGLFVFSLHRDEDECALLLDKVNKAIAYKEYIMQRLGIHVNGITKAA